MRRHSQVQTGRLEETKDTQGTGKCSIMMQGLLDTFKEDHLTTTDPMPVLKRLMLSTPIRASVFLKKYPDLRTRASPTEGPVCEAWGRSFRISKLAPSTSMICWPAASFSVKY